MSIYKGRLKSKKQPAQPVFLAKPLTPTAARPLSRGRELERGQQAARLVLGRLGSLGKIAEIRGMPSPQPSPTGEGAGCSGFGDFGDLKGNLDLPLISGRLKSKKAASTT